MGTDYILITIALLAALVRAGGSNFIKVVCLSLVRLVSGMILAGAPIALTFSPIRNDLPYTELSINFAFKISRAVVDTSPLQQSPEIIRSWEQEKVWQRSKCLKYRGREPEQALEERTYA